MEFSFRADFSGVRIHTGPLAAAAAQMLGADAFTAGREIFFGEGRFAPGTHEGRRLLAHELAHVLQQQSGPASGDFTLGAPDDPQEDRATELAREALSGGRVTAVVPDCARVVRRTVTVHEASAKISLDFAGARPDAFVAQDERFQTPGGGSTLKQILKLHLGRNFSPGRTQDIGAWQAIGQVDVTFVDNSPQARPELQDWNFGFIQFMEVRVLNAFYAGRTPSDGGILLQGHSPPALSRNLGRDSFGADVNPPWTRSITRGNLTLSPNGIAANRTEDHPQLSIPTDLYNRAALYPNFLFRVTDTRKFVVIFSAREPAKAGGAFRHLAHFEIDLVYDFDVIWRLIAGEFAPVVTRRPESRFEHGPVRLGAPTSSAIRPFLGDPSAAQHLGTTQLTSAVQAAIAGGPPNRNESKQRIGFPPADFII
jgi:hypothetical protein